MISDMLLFLRIGFLFGCKNELLFERRDDGRGDELGIAKGFELMVWRGPYSHVTSQSLSLKRV